MEIEIFNKKEEMGAAAAAAGIAKLKEVLAEKDSASIIVATGVSQFDVLAILSQSGLPWNKITVFHLDEYVGLPITHEASFRKYLWERFVTKLPLPPAAFHFLDGEGDVVDGDDTAEVLREVLAFEYGHLDSRYLPTRINVALTAERPKSM